MRTTVAIVADDLTGAADAGSGFRRAGQSTSVVWSGVTADGWPLDSVDVVAVDAGTRARSREAAVERTSAIVTAVRRAGVPHLFKKIDSTLRGNVGDEIAASWHAWHSASIAIVAPAFPAMGRTTRNGEQCIDGVPLPIGAIAPILERAGLRTDHADLGRVRGGTLHLRIEEAAARGVRALVCDAATNDDLAAVARGGAPMGSRALWVGTAGLAGCLPAALRLNERQVEAFDAGSRKSPAPVLVVVGSRTSTARQQTRVLSSSGVCHFMIAGHLLSARAGQEAARRVEEIGSVIDRGEDVVVSIGGSETSGHDDDRLPRQLGDWLKPFAGRIGGVILTGGDTARGVLDAWGVSGLRLAGEIEPGVPVAAADGPLVLTVVTKAGGFGAADTLLTAVRWFKAQPSFTSAT
jgi:4-hydroxythreonine-4-phosphate dehydrogenase